RPVRHATPHHFPARRSSDLQGIISQQMMADAEMARVGVNERELDLRAQQQEFERGLLRDPTVLGPKLAAEAGLPPTAIPGIVQQDRKSTRLNSSHVKISYAV